LVYYVHNTFRNDFFRLYHGRFNNAITSFNEATSGIYYIGELNSWMGSLGKTSWQNLWSPPQQNPNPI